MSERKSDKDVIDWPEDNSKNKIKYFLRKKIVKHVEIVTVFKKTKIGS